MFISAVLQAVNSPTERKGGTHLDSQRRLGLSAVAHHLPGVAPVARDTREKAEEGDTGLEARFREEEEILEKQVKVERQEAKKGTQIDTVGIPKLPSSTSRPPCELRAKRLSVPSRLVLTGPHKPRTQTTGLRG